MTEPADHPSPAQPERAPNPRPARFRWPPAGDAQAEPSQAAPRQEPTPGERRGRSGHLATGVSVDADIPHRSGVRAWIEDIEATWLGVTAPPWDVRARDAGWWPDASAQYCPRCGTSVGEFEADGEGCPACRGLVVPWARFVRLGAYEGVLRDAVHEIKYTAWRRLGHDLGAILGRQTQEVLSREGLGSARVVLVPVPTNPLRRLVRGIDHTLTLCRGMSRATGWTIQPVLRRRWGPSQVRVMPSKRRANVSGTMWRSGPELAADVVVLVDDVRTTGATLMEAARALGGGGGGSGGGGTGGGGGAAMMWAAALCVAGAGPGGRTKLVFDRVKK